jgi:hypothetical protein
LFSDLFGSECATQSGLRCVAGSCGDMLGALAIVPPMGWLAPTEALRSV